MLNPEDKIEMVSNCEYAIVLGKQLKFSLGSIGGVDLVDGNHVLTSGMSLDF